MFASVVPDLAKAAAQVTLVCDARLERLFARSFPRVQVLGAKDARLRRGDFDKVIAMGSLGRLYRSTLADFPGEAYLQSDPEGARRWADRLGPKAKPLRIGVSWRGGTRTTRTAQRSLRLDQLAPLLDLGDCEFVSLQYGDVTAEVGAFNTGRENPLRLFPPHEIEDFDDLAALLETLDLVVSVQTSVAHLAGAIGKQCLTLIPHVAEWRYTARSPSMPWYRSMRLVRAPAPDSWDLAIAEVVEAVRQRIGGSAG